MAQLLGGGADLRTGRRTLAVDGFATGAAIRDFFKEHHGPTIAAYRSLRDGSGTSHWEYLLVTATRHG